MKQKPFSNAILKLCIAASCLLAGGLANAIPVVNYSAGRATGISDLVVAGNTYDVSFVFGSFNAVFGGSSPTFLGNFAGADAAANAMGAVLNAEATIPTIGNGASSGVLWSVYSVTATNYLATQIGYQNSLPWQRFGNFFDDLTSDRTGSNWAFAVFTPNAVPEPATLVLFGLGFAGLGFSKRKRAA